MFKEDIFPLIPGTLYLFGVVLVSYKKKHVSLR